MASECAVCLEDMALTEQVRHGHIESSLGVSLLCQLTAVLIAGLLVVLRLQGSAAATASAATPAHRLPCCGREGSASTVCVPCMALVCAYSPVGVGRCPLCRASVRLVEGRVEMCANQGQCVLCRQLRVIEQRSMCAPCFKGMQHPLPYECERCHGVQRIGHPMFTYQPTPEQYGSATWSCHVRCGDYTHWRITADGLAQIPADWPVPVSWPQHQEALAQLRADRRNGLTAEDIARRREQGSQGGDGAAGAGASTGMGCLCM
jgi:hypothetical protein